MGGRRRAAYTPRLGPAYAARVDPQGQPPVWLMRVVMAAGFVIGCVLVAMIHPLLLVLVFIGFVKMMRR